MASVAVFPRATYLPGRRFSSQEQVSVDRVVEVLVARDALVEGLDYGAIEVQYSRDGTTWALLCRCTVTGEKTYEREGIPDPHTIAGVTLPALGFSFLVRVVWDLTTACVTDVTLRAGATTSRDFSGPQPPRSTGYDAGAVGHAASTATLSYAATLGSVSNGILLVFTGSFDFGGAANVSTINWNTSEALSAVAGASVTALSAQMKSEGWKRAAPTSGTHNVDITMDATKSRILSCCAQFSGAADTYGTAGTGSGTSGTSLSASATGTADGMVVFFFFSKNITAVAQTIAAASGETERVEDESYASIYATAIMTLVGSGSQSGDATVSDAQEAWTAIGFNVDAAAVAAQAVYVPYPDAWNSVGWMEAPWMAGRSDSRTLVSLRRRNQHMVVR